MSRFYNKPENALKRAEELIGVNQSLIALNLLHQVILSKRFRSTPIASLEPIMLKFVALCVDLRKGKIAKEGLYQYKNISQNVAITTIEVVIKEFIKLSQEKVTIAQGKADLINMDVEAIEIEDLEASETPENIMLSAVSVQQGSKDRTDRELVTPHLKFLWEAYRTGLDILKNNARLELVYQSVANQAFQFCLKYDRKTEFRRLCDLLRQHITTAAKYAHQVHSINLNEPDTLQRHLDTRFVQLNAAAELELWQEAFRSVEDVHYLVLISKKAPKQFMMANYYEKLLRIFMVGEDYLFHAAAWNKYYSVMRRNSNMPEEEHERMASMVLISALSVPIIGQSKTKSYLEGDDNSVRNQRLASLLHSTRIPVREFLVKEALSKKIFSRVLPELRQLYTLIEVDFQPLSITKKISPLMTILMAKPDLAKYAQPIYAVVLTRLIQQLSQVYSCVKIEKVLKLSAFPAPYAPTQMHLEKMLMNACKRGAMSVRVHHHDGTLTFETDVFAPAKTVAVTDQGPRVQLEPTEHVQDQLRQLAKRLSKAMSVVRPTRELVVDRKLLCVRRAKENAVLEREGTVKRRLIIEKKKEIKEHLIAKTERESREARQRIAAEYAESERVRIAAEVKKRDEDRIIQQRRAIEKQESQKLASKLAAELASKKHVKMDVAELEQFDTDKLLQLQLAQMDKEKKEKDEKVKTVTKRHDHVERAFKKEEIPLLKKDYEDQKKVDRAYHLALIEARKQAAELTHKEAMLTKARLVRVNATSFLAHLTARRKEEFEVKSKKALEKLQEAKARRMEQWKAKVENERKECAERLRKEKAKEEERIAAAILKKALEEEEKLAKEEKKREEAERLSKLDAQSKIQAERERKAEEKISRSASRVSEPEKWRAASAASASAPTGRYVVPGRKEEAMARGGSGGSDGDWHRAGTGTREGGYGGGASRDFRARGRDSDSFSNVRDGDRNEIRRDLPSTQSRDGEKKEGELWRPGRGKWRNK